MRRLSLLLGLWWGLQQLALEGDAGQSLAWLSVTGSVTSRASSRKPKDEQDLDREVSGFDQFGAVPIVKTAKRLVLNASPIVALRFSAGTWRNGSLKSGANETAANGTLLAWGYDSTLSPFEQRMHAQTYLTLGHPFQRSVLTGLSGDCRIVGRFLKQAALNHTLEYNTFISGQQLSNKLGEMLQRFTMGGGTRPLISHAFICSGVDGSLYSIDPAGEILKVTAACAGRASGLGKALIEREYRAHNTTLEEAVALARRIINPPSLLAKSSSPPPPGDDQDDQEDDGAVSRELGVEFCVILDQ